LKAPITRLSPEALKIVQEQQEIVQREQRTSAAAALAAAKEELHQRLKNITDGASALKLADELKAERKPSEPRGIVDFSGLDEDLRQLAALWNGELSSSSSYGFSRSMQSARPWGTDLVDLRERAVRDLIARRAQMPDLLKPPLVSMEPEKAVQQVCQDLFTKNEFSRLYQVLSETSRLLTDRRVGYSEENLGGLKSFLTGQNFERAEQYIDAVRSYKTTLGCIGELVPIDAAAERLRVLKKEHPEAFNATGAYR